jgi:hypothetical protein
MDKVKTYRELVKRLISELAARINEQYPAERTGIDRQCVFDEERDHYLLSNLGWSNGHRVQSPTLYVRLRNGKIWIEDDMTEEGLANELLRHGVPKEDIVIAFHPPHLRQHTEFAVA